MNYFISCRPDPSAFYRGDIIVNALGGTIVSNSILADRALIVRVSTATQFPKAKRIVYSLDDSFWDIPNSHPHYSAIIRASKNCEYWLKRADILVATTVEIGNRMFEKSGGRNIIVAENCVPDNWINKSDFTNFNGKITLNHGLNGHEYDIPGSGLLEELAKIREKYEIQSIGSTDLDIGCSSVFHTGVENYITHLRNYSNSIGLIPLSDIQFNKGKSTIKFLEYVICGIFPIASPVGEYKKLTDIFPFIRQEGTWLDSIEKAKNNFDKFGLLKDYVYDKYLLSKKIGGWRKVLNG
jgi:hypothetical protein